MVVKLLESVHLTTPLRHGSLLVVKARQLACRNCLAVISKAIDQHMLKEATAIFGENGLGLKKNDLSTRIKAMESNTSKSSKCLRANDDRYAPKLKLSIPNAPPVKVVNRKMKKMEQTEITRYNTVIAVIKVN